jgi:hypothetical protein
VHIDRADPGSTLISLYLLYFDWHRARPSAAALRLIAVLDKTAPHRISARLSDGALNTGLLQGYGIHMN